MSTNADRDQTIKAITGMMGDDTTGNSLIEQIVKEVNARTLPHHTPEERAAIVHDVVTERMDAVNGAAVSATRHTVVETIAHQKSGLNEWVFMELYRGLWTVGLFTKRGSWQPIADFKHRDGAFELCARLNFGMEGDGWWSAIQVEPRLWSVGFIDPSGRWQPAIDTDNEGEAEHMSECLNGRIAYQQPKESAQ